MANNIERKELYNQLANVKKVETWLIACESLGLRVCRGSKHPSTIRDPKLPDDNGRASLITVIPSHLHKIINQSIFKSLLKYIGDEDSVWKSLKML